MAAELSTAGGYPGSSAVPVHLGKRQRLVDLIQRSGAPREDQRVEEVESLQRAQEAATNAAENGGVSASSSSTRGKTFSADLVYQEGAGGFQLWLGSLDDALSLEGLKEHGITGVLNCALEECRREVASFRCQPGLCAGDGEPVFRSGRRRTHARGASLADDTLSSRSAMPPEVVRGLVEFNECWYSDILACDMAYWGLEAADEDGYRMDQHFDEVLSFLNECRREGRAVLIHCIMGINRSSVALVAFLCSGLGMSLSQSVALASKQRGFILSNDSFLDQLINHFGLPDEDNGEVNEKGSLA